MKISEQWLRQWVNPLVDSETLAEQLTMLGLEIDGNDPVAKPFHGVVVGQVLTVEQHPDADRLRVTIVDAGQGEPLQIVCGAPNVRAGMKAPVALVGAVLPGDLKIKKGKLRGVESNGMLCGASEIDLEDQIDGLLELPDDAPVGVDIREYLQLDDRVLDISITPNRGDCFSVRGIAREVAVINGMAMQVPPVTPPPVVHQQQLPVQVQTAAAPRYLGCIIRGVNATAQTPDWMVQALSRSGIRCHSILVDITNYVLIELGQPLHAFDLGKIEGGIVVRQAQASETLQLLNEQIVELQPDVTVIADQQQVLAIAGIMGGLSSSVTEQTQDIFLESAFFAPLAIAGRARRFGLHTDASQRFERGVDFELPELAMQRACQLIVQYAGGECGPVTRAEQRDQLPVRAPIVLLQRQIDQLLGFALDGAFIEHTLRQLECQVEPLSGGWQVTAPSHRYDLAIYQDLIEEVARIYGYDRIPVSMPQTAITLQPYADQGEPAQLRQLCVTLGYQEAISFSFVDEKLQRLLQPQQQPLALANPISSELGLMRSSLLASLIPCVQYNLNRQQTRVRLFELGLRFVAQNQSADQPVTVENLAQVPTLALIATGDRLPEQWGSAAQPMDFYDLKGDVQHLLDFAQVRARFTRSERPWLHPGQSADIWMDNECIGYLGRLHPAVEQQLDLGATWVAECDSAAILRPITHRFTELSRFPMVRRDIALIIDDQIDYDVLIESIRNAAGEWLADCWLFDVYTGQGIDTGQRSLAFALQFQHPERTLEEQEIKNAMDRVINRLETAYNAKLRAS